LHFDPSLFSHSSMSYTSVKLYVYIMGNVPEITVTLA